MERRREWTLLVCFAVIAGLMILMDLELRRNRKIQLVDIIDLEVRPVLPGRPISGKRLVRPNGMITLGYYGEVHIAGMTPGEAREKIGLHLRRFLSDEALGLVEPISDSSGQPRASRPLDPSEKDRISVRITVKCPRFRSERVIDRYLTKINDYFKSFCQR